MAPLTPLTSRWKHPKKMRTFYQLDLIVYFLAEIMKRKLERKRSVMLRLLTYFKDLMNVFFCICIFLIVCI